MPRYVAFLRGININGKNKINMSDLKTEFKALGFSDVTTYLNSGNIIFKSEADNVRLLIEKMIIEKYGLEIPAYVIDSDSLLDILQHAPTWWNTGDKDKYDNLIFILSSDSPEEICKSIGEPTEGLEQIKTYKNVIFWTFDRAKYQKSNWWKKTASASVAKKLTIRTANTVNKICKIDN